MFGRLAMTAVIVLLLQCCAVRKGPSLSDSSCGSEPASITQKREQNFDGTLHKLLLQQTCVNCHDGQSGLAPFPHSSANLVQAYQAAVQLVDLGDPASSIIVKKIQGDHNCGSDAQCQALAGQMIAAIQTWAQEESSLPPVPKCAGDLQQGLTVSLSGKLIQASTLSMTTATTLRWDLGALNAALSPMWFSIDAIGFTAPSTNGPGSYKIQNLVLASGSLRVKVLSVIPVINGTPATQYGNFAGLNFVVGQQSFDPTASILGFAPLSDYPEQISWQNVTSGDTLGFEITIQQTTDPPTTTTHAPGCKAYAKFQLVYDNVFALQVPGNNNTYVGQCTRCHGDPKQAANAVMNLSGNGVDPCLQALMRVNLTNPLQSLLLLKPSRLDQTAAQNTGNEHPVLIDLMGDPALNSQKALILDWINAEAHAAGLP